MKDKLELVVDWIKTLVDTAQSEIPELAKEIVSFGMYSNLFYSLICLISTLCFIFIFFKCMKILESDKIIDDDTPIFIMLISGLLIFVFFIATCNCFSDFIKSYTSPRLYVIDYLRK